MAIEKHKTLFFNLNLLKLENSTYKGYCWSPKENEENIIESLHKISKKEKILISGQLQEAIYKSDQIPPTYFKVNDFTSVFQVKIFYIC